MNTKHSNFSYESLSLAVNDLIQRGYNTDFSIMEEKDCLVCHANNLELSPEDFVIDEFYRFDGMTNPSDESIVYAISSAKHNVKGLVINSYGANYDNKAYNLVKYLNQASHNDR